MSKLLVFGPGYTARRIAAFAEERGWAVEPIGRAEIEDCERIERAIARATHILSSVPPDGESDPVLAAWGDALSRAPARWIGYLSSTGVYGDSGGAWVDETSSVSGRRGPRNAADAAWLALHSEARIFRLPGIYGPGRSPLDRLLDGSAQRVDVPGQVFSRVHVDDIATGVMASIDRGRPGIYNLADDLPAPQQEVTAFAARLLDLEPPPLVPLAEAGLSPAARAFYAENRRVANGKARRRLGWRPAYPTYREGLVALCRARIAMTMPAKASAAPDAAVNDQA